LSLRLFLNNLKLGRWGLLAWTVIIFLYALLTMSLYPTMKSTDIFSSINEMPEAFQAAFGWEGADFILTPESFAAMELLVLWPVLIGIYAIFSSIGIAREVERGTIDLLLAQPVQRYKILISKFAVFVLAAILIASASLVGLIVGSAMIQESVDIITLSLVLIEALLFVLVFASLTLFFATIFLQPRKSLLAAGVLMAGSYILNFIIPIMDPSISWLRNLSLFYYYQPQEIISNASLNGTAIVVYAGVAMVAFVAAILVFQRRDIST
jgi:ABC-2 type transport system permease protein|tara:strand:- start:29 stop:829 length:801 start_codon:yes stop_codon:yes gene_type:complete